MNWTQAEPPRIKHDSNILNNHVLKGMERADCCAKWLKAQGFTVLSVHVGRRNPRIEILPSHLCKKLDGAVYITERSNQGTKRGWVALRHGCEVRWEENCGGVL